MDLSKIKEKLKSSPKLVTYAVVALTCIALLLLMNTSSDKEIKTDGDEIKAGDTYYKSSLEMQLESIV